MKHYLLLFLFLISSTVFGQKVGLVLSGGGAKGLAHIGLLKALEENNIPIDYVAGTSMGGIVAAMYAAGYTPSQIERVATSPYFQNWVNGRLKSDYKLFYQNKPDNASFITARIAVDTAFQIKLQANLINDVPLNFALLELFSQASASAKYDFDSLFVPFRCVVSDILSQEPIILKKGNLTDAVRGTMSVPFVYRPIKIDNKYVFDGGVYNNFPVDVMKEDFNPDVLIGCNVSSKIYNDYPKEIDERLMSRFAVFLFLSKSDSTQIGQNGVYIQPELKEFSVTNFEPVEALIQRGYDAAMKNMSVIKARVLRRTTPEELKTRRTGFLNKNKIVSIQDVMISGVKSQQRRYIKDVLGKDGREMSMGDLKKGYYKLMADDVFESVYPRIEHDSTKNTYNFNLNIKPDRNFKIDFGGNLSTRPISNIFLGLQYNFVNREAYTLCANFYSGRFYESMQLGSRIDIGGIVPAFVEFDYTYNHWNYFRNSEIFVEDLNAVPLDQSDKKLALRLGFPYKGNTRLIVEGSLIRNFDKYSPTEDFSSLDILDQTEFDGQKTSFTLERKTFNRKQYPTEGSLTSLSVAYISGLEDFTPGSVSTVTAVNNKERQWLSLKAVSERYFKLSKRYTIGYALEGLWSNQPSFTTYRSSLVEQPAAYLMQDSHSLFLANFRAYNYLNTGLRNVFTFRRNLDFRVEVYGFIPFDQLQEGFNQQAVVAAPDQYFRLAATAGAVYRSFIGPISLSANYYDDPQKRWGVLLHLGFLLYNKKSLE
ncbi:patatin-like phospholipase family protein [Solitalea sp. MAHUQ-68]|uniref:Patatin-like phospholipase family protein n=1 Tax=Solitalea agri TaxID=2953739 RepID=A0A9X2JDL9_9SPHI|nr:patatin-like phospholipase family protein [Solitalea agri]MCO4291506.1 patatin-like phospholipase family protein [Solitalea agri]